MSLSRPLLEKVAEALRRLGLFGQGMLVAVSGGPDSVALFHALRTLRGQSGGPLVLAHINHRLRGAESDQDEEFVRGLAQAYSDVGLGIVAVEVSACAAQRGENLEATARQERYRCLAELARAHHLSIVTTGHTADDQAETVLHRLLRGAGLQGLRGIAERRPLAEGIELVRPLLEVTRAEVQNYLVQNQFAARQDSSNDDMSFTRNRLRRQLLPLLAEQYNPAIRDVLLRLADEAAEVHQEEEDQARRALAAAELPRADALIVLDRNVLAGLTPRQVRSVLRLVWQREGWPAGAMTRDHWKRLARVALGGPKAVDLPDGIRACRRDPVVQIGPVSARSS